VLNPTSLKNAVNLGKAEGIDIRPTESGARWQQAGLFAADGSGRLIYSRKAQTSDDLGDLDAALKSAKSTQQQHLFDIDRNRGQQYSLGARRCNVAGRIKGC